MPDPQIDFRTGLKPGSHLLIRGMWVDYIREEPANVLHVHIPHEGRDSAAHADEVQNYAHVNPHPKEEE